ncbi:uncharacterized protein BYT42DRAFT_576185 [Radiomyces spectabilis]|uniref:uncharacterized protein n=1 Tax=Radiomyces spectabilis TaxID=64574 RepID=UPI00222055CC|nr:uncharacterized protein BYT42DRAFT_576185 [Radiomyces spectabilis]KAI8374389.1 hypothetical protein BYT42DRAFT_576185 [Radiomyces spectabilis]
MGYQQRIEDLLKLCQSAWVPLQSLHAVSEADAETVHKFSRALRAGIKQLVQLQDALDENHLLVTDPAWMTKTDAILDDVRKTLHEAMQVREELSGNSSDACHDLPLPIINDTTCFIEPCPIATKSTPLQKSFPSLLSPKMETPFLSPHHNLAINDPLSDHLDTVNVEKTLRTSSRESGAVMPGVESGRGKSNVTPSSIPQQERLSSSVQPRPSVSSQTLQLPSNRRLLPPDPLVEARIEAERGSRLRLPLLKGIKSSRSTPLPSEQAKINFYKDDEDDKNGYGTLFASDAMVSHPLRIGIGYGSYICYSCTILSSKGPPIVVRKRYSDFVCLREALVKQYPHMKNSIPKLPPKKVVGKFTPTFVEQRRRELEYFFKYIVLHPSLGASPIVKQWIAP